MTAVQIASTQDELPAVEWDTDCDQWIAFDLAGIPHWSDVREGAELKAIEASNLFFEHLAKCPSDAVLLTGGIDWKDDPRNFKCNGVF